MGEREAVAKALSILAEHLESMAAELREVLKELAPEAAIPELDLEALPWKKKDKTPASPGDWGWILGPASKQGPPEGAEPLVMLLDQHGGSVELPPYEIEYSNDRVFIRRKPIKGGMK